MTTTADSDAAMSQAIVVIAHRTLLVETLETRHSDSLDFHDCAIWSIKEALEAAYIAGRASTKAQSQPSPRSRK